MNKLQQIFPMLIFILVSFSLFVVFLSFDFFFVYTFWFRFHSFYYMK